MADDGNGMIYLPILNYMDGNLDFTKELLQREDIVASLSDGGAHCGTICDAASPTFLLSYWARDRKAGTIPLELAVKRQCHDTARLYGLNDRGVLKPGYLADINVIGFLDALKLLRSHGWRSTYPPVASALLQRLTAMPRRLNRGVVVP
jgi:N-acyl-D-aspartate/D-glutamate deacylase